MATQVTPDTTPPPIVLGQGQRNSNNFPQGNSPIFFTPFINRVFPGTNPPTLPRGNNSITFTPFGQTAARQAAGFNQPNFTSALNRAGINSSQINTSTTPFQNTPPPGPQTFVGQIPFFLNAILSTPAGALPKGPLWVIVFDFDEYILNTIKSVKQYEPRMPEPWLIDSAVNTVTTKRYQEEKGCMFAQTVTIPGDSLNYNQEGITYNSFIRGGVGSGRRDFDPLRISFLNTNVNFVDNVIRPWVVMTGHLGMVARPREQKYRCNLTIYRLGIDRVDRPPFVAQQFNFWEVCPINVLAEELSYTAEGTSMIKQAEFVYQWYTTTSYKNTFATQGIEASPVGNVDVRRASPTTTPTTPGVNTPTPQQPQRSSSPNQFR
jgi:hypothetical protein